MTPLHEFQLNMTRRQLLAKRLTAPRPQLPQLVRAGRGARSVIHKALNNNASCHPGHGHLRVAAVTACGTGQCRERLY